MLDKILSALLPWNGKVDKRYFDMVQKGLNQKIDLISDNFAKEIKEIKEATNKQWEVIDKISDTVSRLDERTKKL